MNISKCTSKGPSEGTISLINLDRTEAYELYFALKRRAIEAKSRLDGGYDYTRNKIYHRQSDEATVRICTDAADSIHKLLI